jgi:hypothetical protein
LEKTSRKELGLKPTPVLEICLAALVKNLYTPGFLPEDSLKPDLRYTRRIVPKSSSPPGRIGDHGVTKVR